MKSHTFSSPAATALMLSSLMMLATTSRDVSAQIASVDSTAPKFTQTSANVYRRFAVDFEKMKVFYGDILGLKLLPLLNMPGGGTMNLFQIGSGQLKLQKVAAGNRPAFGAVKDAVGIRLLTFFFPDEAVLTARFKEHGYPAPAFHSASGGTRVATAADPDGQWVELLVTPGAPAAQFDRIEIGLSVSDLARSRAFYRGFVGLEEQKPVEDAMLGTTKYPYRVGTTTINLWSAGKRLPANTITAGIQYVVGNVEAINARAQRQGVRIDRPLSDFTANLRTVWLSDSDGIVNYFAQIMRRTATEAASR